jgi:hypothetical protein
VSTPIAIDPNAQPKILRRQPARRLRVAVWLDQGRRSRWIDAAVGQIAAAPELELVGVIVVPTPLARKMRPLAFVCSAIDRGLFGAGDDHSANPAAPEQETSEQIQVNRRTTSEEFELQEEDTARIEALSLDVLIDLGARKPPSRLAACTTFGVWSFVSNLPSPRDSHAILGWYGNRPVTELSLQAQQRDREMRTLYVSTLMQHPVSLQRTRAADAHARTSILLSALLSVQQRGELPAEPGAAQPTSELPARRNGVGDTVRWVRPLSRAVVEHLVRPRWVLAYRDRSAGETGFQVVQARDGSNYADPFLFEHQGSHYIFFEAWQDGRDGVIRCLELRDGVATDSQIVLARPYHLSYPHVLEWQGRIYMVPETAANRSIEVYRAVEFPGRWELDTVLMEKISAVDSTILSFGGKLWLFTAGVTGPELRTSELSLFFADSLRGPWIPHPKNPIVCDVRRARPAGPLFFHNGELFRPGQDSSKDYGYAVCLNRVEVLSTTEYRERPVSRILPDWLQGITACHTVGYDSRFEVRDAKLSWRQSRLFHCIGADQ